MKHVSIRSTCAIAGNGVDSPYRVLVLTPSKVLRPVATGPAGSYPRLPDDTHDGAST